MLSSMPSVWRIVYSSSSATRSRATIKPTAPPTSYARVG